MADANAAGRVAALHTAAGRHVDGVLCLCAAMREHGGGGAAGDQFLEMAGVPVALHGRSGMGSGIHHLARRALAGLGLRRGREEKHPTSNIEHPMNQAAAVYSTLGVRCSMFNIFQFFYTNLATPVSMQ